MSDGAFAALFGIVFLIFGGVGLILLTRPALFLRLFPNPFMPDTPINRVQLRGLGLGVCLMLLMMSSGMLSGALTSPTIEAFADNMLLALWISFFGIPILLWIIWQVSLRAFMRRCYINGTFEDTAWERRMTITFCSILLFTVTAAWIFAAKGIHAPFKRHAKSAAELKIY
jgi:hypothetical protein